MSAVEAPVTSNSEPANHPVGVLSQNQRRRNIEVPRNFETILKAVRKGLSQKSSEIALCLLRCNEAVQSVYGQARETLGRSDDIQDFLTAWRKIASNFDQIVSQTRLSAVDGASTVAGEPQSGTLKFGSTLICRFSDERDAVPLGPYELKY
ncbi:hypothetical protein SCHPADRAFT_363012 [Schizopora paradoxa]|uniref:Uncharacterized protein n=1 Tax=Schizopora paradoxa TaxID=27342 RepID=A0A0H2RNM3_9AGAM|nr:hypothetical protein SCHPADRAFT_363012 [Schizopora paradoxa]